MTAPSLADDLALAMRMADAADAIGLAAYTGEPLPYRTKADGSSVTDTDSAIEERLLAMVRAERSGDAFTGEEVGRHDGENRRRWHVDGIDGTIVFVRGEDSWGTNIGLEVDGEVVLGVRTNPAIGRRWWAVRGGGAWTDRDGRDAPPVRIEVSGRATLDGAVVSLIPPLEALDGEALDTAERVVAHVAYTDPVQHAALLVAEGVADTSVQLHGGPWDFAALVVIIEEAGGRYSTADGSRSIDRGGPVVFSNGALHQATLDLVNGSGPVV